MSAGSSEIPSRASAKYSPAITIANAENAAGGNGITEDVGRELFMHADILTSGNHIWDKKEALPYIDREPRLLRPANYPPGNPGHGSYIFTGENGVASRPPSTSRGGCLWSPWTAPFEKPTKRSPF
jgi:calcineurin-like phosphoesterase